METSDKGQVVIHTIPGSPLTQPGVYEVIAKVIDASQVQEASSLAFEGQFGKDIDSILDADSYEQFIKLSQKLHPVFG
jgi:hypothetical protein